METKSPTANRPNPEGATMYLHRDGTPCTTAIHDVNKNGDSASTTRKIECFKCNGSGFIQFYSYIEAGRCFACNAVGYKIKIEKVYTAEKIEKLNVARDKRAAKAVIKANEKTALIESARAEAFENFKQANADLMRKYGELDSANEFIADVMYKAWRFGELSARQTESVEAAIERALTDQANAETALDVIEGRIAITGLIVSTKSLHSQYGTQFKMLVVDDRGFKVWGSIPSDLLMPIDELRQERVTFTATVERSNDDPKFGFFKRPTKAELECWTD